MSNDVNLSPGSIKELATAIASQLGSSSGGSSSAKSSPVSNFNWMGVFKDTIGGATDAVKGLASGTWDTVSVMGQASKVLSQLDPTGISKPLSAIGEGALGTVKTLNNANRQIGGLDFAGDIGKFNSSAKNMMLTQDQLVDVYKRSNGALNGLGPTVNKSAANFTKLGEDFSKSQVSTQLAAIGINMEEQADLQAEYIANNRFLNLQDADVRARTIQSFGAFAVQLDENSRLTGLSKKAQTDAINEQAKNVRVMAAVSQLGPEAMNNFKNMQSGIVGLGQNVQMAASAIYTGGPKNEQERAAIAAMGPAASTFEKAVLMSKEAGNDPAKKAAADRQMEIARNQIIAYQRSKEFTDAVQTGKGAVADAMRTQYEQNKYGPSAQFMANQEPGKTQSENMDSQRKIAEQERLRIGPDGKPLAGASVSMAANVADKALLNVTASTTTSFEKLNVKVGETIDKYGAVNKLFDAASGGARDTMTNKVEGGVDKAYSMIPGTDENAATNTSTKNNLNKLRKARETRDLGTWGMTGQMFEPMDKVVKISKGEIVLDPQQAKNFVSKMGEMSGAPAETPTPTAVPPAPSAPSIGSSDASLSDLKDLLEQLNMRMGDLVEHSSSTAEYAKKQVNAIKGVSGNMWA